MSIAGVSPALAPPLPSVATEAAEATPLVNDGIEAAPVTAHGAEAAATQTVAKTPTAPTQEATRTNDAMPGAESLSESALPSAQLVPATLVGLAVDAETWWNFPRDPAKKDDPAPHEDDELVEADRGDWCEALTRAVRDELTAPNPPAALRVASEEWRRGRWVALAAPRGADPAGPAWLFVVWRPEEVLAGIRIPARLRWSASPRAARWVHARLVKQYHAQRGRELVAPQDAAQDRVPCVIQFGPLVPALRTDVSVRIDAVRAFWAALDVQWSVWLAVAAKPIGSVA